MSTDADRRPLAAHPELAARLAAARAATDELHASVAREARLLSQLAAVRSDWRRTRVAALGLHTAVAHLRGYPRAVAAFPADGPLFTPPGGSGRVVQRLPFAAEGLAGVDLYVDAGDGRLSVTFTLDDGRTLGTATAAADPDAAGWARAWLPRAVRADGAAVEVAVEWHEGGPAVALGTPDGCDAARLESASGPPLKGSLALVLWAAGPGRVLTAPKPKDTEASKN